MLSERQKLVLIAIVEEYVRTNEPVGSLALSKRPELGFSTATLRNDMASLEEMGYLEKTHTSSGRIPSQKGYKLYVQDIIMRKQNDQLEFPLIDEIFNRPNITREEAITEAKIFKHLKGCVLCQNGYIKLAGSQNHIMGQIPLIDSDGDPLGGIGDLGNGIDDAAVILLLIFCREDEQTIA